MSKTVDVRARIDADEKQRASDALAGMGLTVSQAIRLFLNDVAENKSLPFKVKVPNQQTIQAMQEADRGEGETYDTVDDLMRSLMRD